MYNGDFSEFDEWDDEAEELDHDRLYKSKKNIVRKLNYRTNNHLFDLANNTQRLSDIFKIIKILPLIDIYQSQYNGFLESENSAREQLELFRNIEKLTDDEHLNWIQASESHNELNEVRIEIANLLAPLMTEFSALRKKQQINIEVGENMEQLEKLADEIIDINIRSLSNIKNYRRLLKLISQGDDLNLMLNIYEYQVGEIINELDAHEDKNSKEFDDLLESLNDLKKKK
ncbi:MAG: hypothetical protein ABIN24_14515 [Dyadobacter sp.]